jgi:histidinol-phosphate aminotransferase
MSTPDSLVAPNIERLSPYVPGKPIEELERELGIRDAVKLASNENPIGPSPRAIEAAAQALRNGHRYPEGFKLRRALADHHGVALEQIVLGNGSNELIDIVARTFALPNGHAVYPDPSFVCYRMSTTAMNVPATEVPLVDHVAYDIEALIAAVRPETNLLFLANPNNPTGAYVGRAGLERLLRSLPERVIAVLDEAYCEFADAPDYVSALELRELHENLIVLRTFSKAYGLAAYRVGYGIAPARIVDYLDRVRAPFNVSSIGIAAACAALEDREHLARYVAMNGAERAKVSAGLAQLGLRVAPSQANFVLVDFGTEARPIYERLLRKGVIVRPMPKPISSSLRITIGLPAENERMLQAVQQVIQEGR